ncbi:MAG: hypothetical protein HY801_03195 [Candidatus Lindowbacteria bacterium]|nr:hypothetical protein [Candidatus Lindowbacteria bacterium]
METNRKYCANKFALTAGWPKRATVYSIIVLTFMLSACSPSREFLVRPAPQATRLNRIAVFPLENLSGTPEAGDRATAALVSKLYNSNLVNLVEPGEVQQFIIRSRIRVAGELDLDTIREAARQLTADGIIFGSVNEYTFITTDLGQVPTVSIALRLVDADTGEIVWAATHSLQGDFKETVFGIGRVNSVVTLSEIAVDDLIEALGVAMYPEREELYAGKAKPAVKPGLKPAKPPEAPVLPTAPPPTGLEAVEGERERARGAVLKEWESIKGMSQ